MWSLPNISVLNEQAEKRYASEKSKTKKQLLKGHTCDVCSEPAVEYLEYYDVFSDVPKGRAYGCQKHYDDGSVEEGFFYCEDCGKLHIENYTWEYYRTVVDDTVLCLNCAFDRYIENEDNWITCEDLKEGFGFDTIRRSPHIIPVSGTHHQKYLDFIGNVEFDSSTGKELYGTREGGVRGLKELVKKALKTHSECILILDAAYQFAVSVGVYVRKEA